MGWGGIRAERQGHGRATRRLSHDEGPAGQVAPELAEAAPAVDVGPARLRVQGREPSRRGRVAIGDTARDDQADEQTRTGRLGSRRERREHSGPEDRAQPDDHGVEEPEAARQRGHRLPPGRWPTPTSLLA